ncbi:endonuclease/exonuclease/phosphatase family protein [Asticcacaulis sp. AND118]|uniref:endonuclease/exonuclease/phosphatase family protein n=1 Tax=Asticcacaulis sp. AND118 TaxID=2840468 RepID=UPI001CFFEB6D|nr:endonuclease/exonuclease/phosphatase family protein [Asticcacaulis sp. AND118]UDF02610.1 endonuclease/exonuclease/phosphatase family protein [Asticcacaulis sp. AND118]
MFILRLFSVCGFLLSLALLGAGAVCLLDPHQAKGYLIDIFTAPLLCASVVAAFILIQLRQRASALISLIATVLLLVSLWPQISPAGPQPSETAKPVRLMFANLYVKNETPDRLLNWVREENPDIVTFVEAGPLADETLAGALRKTYPHMARRYDTFVFSRYPLDRERARPIGYSLLTVDVDAPSGPIHLAVAHLTRPWPFTAPDTQPRQLLRLNDDLMDEKPERTVLVGDFNTTPSASALIDFSRGLGMTAAPAPTGTWPAVLPGPVRIGIDNAYAGKGLSLRNRKVGPYYGSDHRPIIVDIYPAK